MTSKKHVCDSDRIIRLLEDGFLRADNDGNIIMANEAIAVMCGYSSPEEMTGLHMTELYANAHDRSKMISEIRSKGKLRNYELELRRKDGSRFWSQNTIKTFSDEKCNVLGTEGLIKDITKQRQTETDLKHISQLLAATGEMARVGGWQVDTATNKVTWSDETYRIHEVPMDYEPTVEEAINFFHPDDRPILKEALRKAVDKGEPYDLTLRFITAKGKHLITRTKCRAEMKNGKVTKLKGTFQDVTDTKKAEEKLQAANQQLAANEQQLRAANQQLSAANQQLVANEQQLRASNQQLTAMNQQLAATEQQLRANEVELNQAQLFADKIANTTPALVYIYDAKEQKNIWTNDVHKAYFRRLTNNYPNMDLNNIAEFIHEDDFNEVLEKAQEMNDNPDYNNYSVDIRVKSVENEWKWMILKVSTFSRDKNGKLLQTIGALFDITDRKKAELNLKKRNEFIQKILDNFPVGIATNEIDSNKVTYINPKFAGIYGWPKEEFPTTHHFFEKVFPNPEKRMKLQQKIMADIKSGDPERMNWDNLEIITQKGEKRIVHAFNIPLLDQNIMISTVQDVTERKKQERLTNAKSTISQLILHKEDDDLYAGVLDAVLKIMESKYGVFGYINNEGALVCPSMTKDIWSECNMMDKTIVFPKNTWGNSIWGNGLRDKKGAYSNKPFKVPEGHLPVDRFMTIPLVYQNKSVGLISVGNKATDYTDDDFNLLQEIADYLAPVIAEQYQRKIALESLVESEEKFRSLYNQSPMGIYMHELDGRISEVNEVACQQLGYTEEEILKMSVFDIHPKSPETTNLPKVEILKQWKNWKPGFIHTITAEHQRKDGTVFPVEVTTGQLKFGDRTLILSMVQDIKARKKYEAKILDSQQRLKEAEKIGKLGHVDWIVAEQRSYWSDEVFRIYERDPNLGVPGYEEIMNLHAPEDAKRLETAVIEALQNGADYDLDLEAIMPSGNKKTLHIIGKPIADNNGNVTNIKCVVQDITERVQAENALREGEIKLKNIIEHSTNLFYSHSAEHEITFISPQVRKYLGYEPEEVMENWTSFITDNPINEKAIEYTEKAIQTGKRQPTYELEMQHKDGQKIIVEVREAPVVENGKVVSIVGSLADITERKIAEEALKKSRRDLQALISNSPICTKIINLDFNLQYMSESGIKQLKINDVKEFYGKPYPLYFFPETFKREMAEKLKEVKKTLKTMKHEGELADTEGNRLWYHHIMAPIKDDKGKLEYILVVSLDISQRKKVENELFEAKEKAEESDRLKSAFLANMSHEIRTPMNGIMGFAELLKEPDLHTDQQQEYVTIIEKSGERMLNIINEIIDISKIESGTVEVNLKEVNVNTQLDYLHTFFKPEAANKGLDLVLKNTLTAEEANIVTDGEKVSAVLINLLKNAIKYTNKGCIEFGCDLKKNEKSTFLQYSVADTGVGIACERQEAIFDRFIQADIEDINARQGAGLGLAISKAYIEMLGGKLWLDSQLGEGSTFYFTISYKPLINKVDEVKHESESVDDTPHLNLKVLIAEDDESSMEYISIIIRDCVKEVVRAKTGPETIEACRDNPDIDLILMDIQMPEVNGYDATQQIRQFNKDVVIIAQTAYGLTGDREKALEAGCNDYIAKPIKKAKLLELIQKYFNYERQNHAK